MSCNLSQTCKKHSSNFANYREIGYLTSGFNNCKLLDSSNNKSKELMCRLINDKAIRDICKQYSLIIDSIEEIPCHNTMKCLGFNMGKGIKIAIVLEFLGTHLDYSEIVGIILHELTHCFFSDHNEDFYTKEKELRSKYINLALSHNIMSPWSKFNLPLSDGKYLLVLPSIIKKIIPLYWIIHYLFQLWIWIKCFIYF